MQSHRHDGGGPPITRSALPAGAVIGPYRVLRAIATDENGFTYFCERLNGGDGPKKISLREFLPALLAERRGNRVVAREDGAVLAAFDAGKEDFRLASHAAEQIIRRGLVPILERIEANGTVYRAAEIAIGTSYQEVVQRGGPISPGDVSNLLTILLPALFALERAELFHGEISPASLIYTRDEKPVLLPSTTLRSAYRSEPAYFQPSFETAYMPPEILLGQSVNYGVSSELYSVAATCLFLLTGEAPLSARDRFSTSDGGLEINRLSKAHPDAAMLLSQLAPALELEPSRRPSSIRALVERLVTQQYFPPPTPPAPIALSAPTASNDPAPKLASAETVNRRSAPKTAPPLSPTPPPPQTQSSAPPQTAEDTPPPPPFPVPTPKVSPPGPPPGRAEPPLIDDLTPARIGPPPPSVSLSPSTSERTPLTIPPLFQAALDKGSSHARRAIMAGRSTRISPVTGAAAVFVVIAAGVLVQLGRSSGATDPQDVLMAGSESSALLEAARQRALDERETASQALPAPQMEPMPQPSNEPDRSTTETGSPAPPNPSPSVPALDTETPPTAIDGVGGLDEPIPADAADPADAAATRAWAALDQQDPAAIRAWIAEHPGTRDRPIALKQLEALDDQAWLAALASDTEPAYRLYLEDYGTARTPPGKRANSAETRIIQIQNETALINAEARRLMTALGAFEPDTSITPGQFQDAVTTFQDLVGLEVTGRVTPELINALEESLAARAIALTPPATPTPAQAPPPETNDAPIIDDPIFGAIGDGTETDGPIAASTIPAPRTSELATVTSTEPDSTPPPDPATPPARAVGETFSDCDECPQMRVLKAGSFTMGSPKRERGRADNEGPAKSVTLSAPFAVSTQEVSRSEFAAYLDDTGQTLPAGCYIEDQSGNGSWIFDAAASFANPGFPQSGDHPAVCVSWQDAKSYTQWLTEKTGRPHRLLTEAEWEYAARGGTKRARFWPGGEDGVCGWANGADRTAKAAREKWVTVACDDGHLFTAPGGAFGANGFGLQDMVGSVWEWVEDCFAPNLSATPSDGTPNTTAGCASRVIRGGSWASSPDQLRAAKRSGDGPVVRYNMLGFRVAADPL